VTIRSARAADADAIAELFIAARTSAMPWLNDPHTDEETYARIADHVFRNLEVSVAEREGVVAGFSAIHQGTLEHLYVHPDHQGVGVGSRLLEEAKASVPDGLELWVFQRNERARRFYEARGFRLVELTDGAGNEEREPDARYVWP
jgi:ribosomal protein S18 acetylase RimI-like enzyme